jgi:signal transduction histidine kinase
VRRASPADAELIARAAHELRGPLGSIANWIHLMSEPSADAALQAQGRASIQRAVAVCTRLLDQLGDLALLRAGRASLRTSALDLVSVVELALTGPRSSARDKGVEVAWRPELPSVPLEGDPDRLAQLVVHLVSNAVKFTPSGGRVELELSRDRRHWRLEVRDTGCGIPAEVVPRLFDDMRPSDFAQPRAAASLGVGLAIVRHVAELHGGSVEASSEGPGRGSRFVVRLPVPGAADGPAARPSAEKTASPQARSRRSRGKQPTRELPGA